MAVRRCTLLDAASEASGLLGVSITERCSLEEGHEGECLSAADIEVEFEPGECPEQIWTSGGQVHCIREEGHSGPHAGGVALDEPVVCGETEVGTGRICLRLPHDQWPGAHDFGPEDPGMSKPPSWWTAEGWQAAENWPGGPVGSVPDMPRWFFRAQRPADDEESVANTQDTEAVIRRRHQAPAVGYGEESGMASAAEVRAAVELGIGRIEGEDGAGLHIQHANSSLRQIREQAAEAHRSMEIAIGALQNAHDKVREVQSAVSRLRAGGEESHSIAHAQLRSDTASERCQHAENAFTTAGEGSGSEMIQSAIVHAASARTSLDEMSGGCVIALDRADEADAALTGLSSSIEREIARARVAMAALKTIIANGPAMQNTLEAGYASVIESAQQARSWMYSI